MTIRQKIYSQLATDLLFLDTTNGYELSLATKLIKGWSSLININTYPCICYQLGEENRKPKDAGGRVHECEVILFLEVFFKVDTEQGDICDYAEQVISDIKKWNDGSNTITGYGTSNHKVLRFNSVVVSSGTRYTGVQKWEITYISPPTLDLKGGKGNVGFEILINYLEASF